MNKNLLFLFFLLILSLIISALIFYFIGQGNMLQSIKINYESIKEYDFLKLFLEILKKNIIYFIIIISLALLGFSYTIYTVFSLTAIIYGISMICFTKIVYYDKLYFILNFTEYLIYFPILFYFTYMSLILSKYIKNVKKIKTNSKKIDIIVKDYIRLSAIFVSLVIVYSLIHSSWIHLILLM